VTWSEAARRLGAYALIEIPADRYSWIGSISARVSKPLTLWFEGHEEGSHIRFGIRINQAVEEMLSDRYDLDHRATVWLSLQENPEPISAAEARGCEILVEFGAAHTSGWTVRRSW